MHLKLYKIQTKLAAGKRRRRKRMIMMMIMNLQINLFKIKNNNLKKSNYLKSKVSYCKLATLLRDSAIAFAPFSGIEL